MLNNMYFLWEEGGLYLIEEGRKLGFSLEMVYTSPGPLDLCGCFRSNPMLCPFFETEYSLPLIDHSYKG